MAWLRSYLRRHAHGAFLVAVAVPLILILALQSWWLTRLQRVAETADRATLANYLDSVLADLLYLYGSHADRALRVPADLLIENRVDKIASWLRKSDFLGARTAFVVRFEAGVLGPISFYDREAGTMVQRPASDETRAVLVACKSYEIFANKGIELDQARITVEERDPLNRIMMLPILGVDSRVVGVAGWVLDEEYLRQSVLDGVIRPSFPRFFPPATRENVIVRVLDQQGRSVFETESGDHDDQELVTRRFNFVFTDWKLVAANRFAPPSAVARNNLWITVLLTGGAAVVLITGLGLALRTASRELRLSQLKSDFLANVSHELRTPLASIRVFAEFLRSGRVAEPERIQAYGEFIDAESRRLSGLVDNLLEFARIESGQKNYALHSGDLLTVVEDVMNSFRVRAEQAGSNVRWEPPGEPLPAVRIDDDAVAQALMNLLDNALKYSPDGTPIEVAAAVIEHEVVVSVKDHGIGIPGEEQRRVFERFHRVGSSLIHDVKGSGLGLSIVEHVMHAHGGRVTLSSSLGRGSEFRLHFPLAV